MTLSLSDTLALLGYVLSLWLIVRVFLWKRHAEKNYWHKRPDVTIEKVRAIANERNKVLPKFSILIPAKEEQEVIEKTIESFCRLNYPKELYEILVVTEEQELMKYQEMSDASSSTPAIVEDALKRLQGEDGLTVKHVMVPYDFDGQLNGKCIGKKVTGFKGRALNYAVQTVSQDTNWISIYDADSRPNPDVLLFVANMIVQDGTLIKVLEGPAYKMYNFKSIQTVCKPYGIGDNVIQEWRLPSLFKEVPYLTGSNLYIERRTLEDVKGFNPLSLNECVDFGVKCYLQKGIMPEFLPCGTNEQIAPTYKSYFKQQLRWACGLLDVFSDVLKNKEKLSMRKCRILYQLFLKGPINWGFHQGFTALCLFLLYTHLSGFTSSQNTMFLSAVNVQQKVVALFAQILPFYFLWKFSPLIEDGEKGRLKQFLSLLIAPVSGLLAVLPFTTALFLKLFRIQPKIWFRTPRTG